MMERLLGCWALCEFNCRGVHPLVYILGRVMSDMACKVGDRVIVRYDYVGEN